MPKLFPAPLSAEVSRPLLAAAEPIAKLAPWEFMSDLELIGLRDEASGNLHVASILGTLGTMFAVVIHRNDAGLRWTHDVVTSRAAPDPTRGLEDMDCLKVEWCCRKDLQKSDLKTLEACAYKPKGRGPVWPRFESCRPGWYPWGVSDAEARLLTELFPKVTRFVRLRETSGPLHKEPLEAEVPIVPAGEASTLRPEHLEWLPFIPPPAPPPEPAALSAEEQDSLMGLPVRRGFLAEMMAPLSAAMSFVDEQAGLPAIGRAVFVVDRASRHVFATRIAHGAGPLKDATGPVLVEALRKAKARPTHLYVDNALLAAALRPACAAIGVIVQEAPLLAAPQVHADFEAYFSSHRPQ